MLQQVKAEVQPRLAAHVNGAISLHITRLVNIPSAMGKQKLIFRSLFELLSL